MLTLIPGKKGNTAAAVLGLILVLLIVLWGLSFLGRECSSDYDCGKDRYCGSDFKCHDFPVIIKEVTKNELLWPSIILGGCIIVAAFIFRSKKENKEEIESPDQMYWIIGNAAFTYPKSAYLKEK